MQTGGVGPARLPFPSLRSSFFFVWNIGKSGSGRKERWRSLGREELWVTPRERERERTLKEENGAANQQNGAEPRIPKRLGLSTRLSFCVCVLSWAHETHSTHCHGRHPPPLSFVRQSLCPSWKEAGFNGPKREEEEEEVSSSPSVDCWWIAPTLLVREMYRRRRKKEGNPGSDARGLAIYILGIHSNQQWPA